MNCAEVMEWMNRYLDHDLSREETLEMYRHIDDCPSCAEMFERLSALSSDLEQLPDVSPPFSLVDSILPRLETIDRQSEAGRSAPAARAEEPQAQQMSRAAARSKSRTGRTAARFGLGAAAAAVIFGIAFLNMPDKVPDAQVESSMNRAYQSGDPGAAAGSAESGNTDSSTADMDSALRVGSGEGDGQENTASPASPESGMSALTAPESAQPPAAPSPVSTAEASVKKQGSGSADGGDKAGESRPGSSKKATASSPAAEPKETGNSDSPLNGSTAGTATPDTSLKAKIMQSSQPGPAGDMGMMGIAAATEGEQSWTSPDGRYAAVLEGTNLVIYAVSETEGTRQAVDTLELKGDWVSGEWSGDSASFTYVTKTEAGEQKGVYTVSDSSPSPSSSTDSPAAPSPTN